MKALQQEMLKAGFQISNEEEAKLKTHLSSLKKRLKKATCNRCGEEIKFVVGEDSRRLPHDPDGTPHWQSCASSSFAQKKASFDIMKKLAVLHLMKYGSNLEKDAGLTVREVQIVQSVLEKIFREEKRDGIPYAPEEPIIVKDDIQFSPEPCDSIGDPDEERAPSEEEVSEVEKVIDPDHRPDKFEVEKAIEGIIQEAGAPE